MRTDASPANRCRQIASDAARQHHEAMFLVLLTPARIQALADSFREELCLVPRRSKQMAALFDAAGVPGASEVAPDSDPARGLDGRAYRVCETGRDLTSSPNRIARDRLAARYRWTTVISSVGGRRTARSDAPALAASVYIVSCPHALHQSPGGHPYMDPFIDELRTPAPSFPAVPTEVAVALMLSPEQFVTTSRRGICALTPREAPHYPVVAF